MTRPARLKMTSWRRAHSGRIRAPEDTVALMRPHFPDLGITRIARLTGLDILGIPCFAVIRPNSMSIASNQGKGVTDALAMASAVMEATEFAIAERPQVTTVAHTFAEVGEGGRDFFHPGRVLPIGYELPDASLDWINGTALDDQRPVLVPFDLVAHNGMAADLAGICQNTNGLASGNTFEEATLHAVCELIERDAGTLWSFLSISEKKSRCFDPACLDDEFVDEFVARFEGAGLDIRLFDQTSDLGVPTVFAVSGPKSARFAKHFDIATGSGTHPDRVQAALRAITEAAQTRITAIAGARDDHPADIYRLPGSREAFALLSSRPRRTCTPSCLVDGTAGQLLVSLLAHLRRRGVDDLVVCELGGARYGISVVRVLSRVLEDRGPNLHWRPGPRALTVLAAAA